MFHPEAVCVYSAAGALLNVYHWEPVKLYHSLDLSISADVSTPSDLAICQKQLVSLLVLC